MDILESYNCNTQITDLESITIQTLALYQWQHKAEIYYFLETQTRKLLQTKVLQYIHNRITN